MYRHAPMGFCIHLLTTSQGVDLRCKFQPYWGESWVLWGEPSSLDGWTDTFLWTTTFWIKNLGLLHKISVDDHISGLVCGAKYYHDLNVHISQYWWFSQQILDHSFFFTGSFFLPNGVEETRNLLWFETNLYCQNIRNKRNIPTSYLSANGCHFKFKVH